MLWDRGETNGYAQHLTGDPYPARPAHEVLMIEAFGDHQVANIATEVDGPHASAPRVHAPALAPGRSPDVEPFWGSSRRCRRPTTAVRYLVIWDFGTAAPPLGNVPNRAGEDPHGQGRGQLAC